MERVITALKKMYVYDAKQIAYAIEALDDTGVIYNCERTRKAINRLVDKFAEEKDKAKIAEVLDNIKWSSANEDGVDGVAAKIRVSKSYLSADAIGYVFANGKEIPVNEVFVEENSCDEWGEITINVPLEQFDDDAIPKVEKEVETLTAEVKDLFEEVLGTTGSSNRTLNELLQAKTDLQSIIVFLEEVIEK